MRIQDLLRAPARSILSFAPYTGLIKPAHRYRPQGISAFMRICNEADTLPASIESIRDHIDEIIAVDTGSTDGTWELLNHLKGTTPNMKVFQYPSRVPWEYSNFALERSTYRWLLKWDADLVAITEGQNHIARFLSRIRSLGENRYYYINPTLIDLTGDFGHQFPFLRTRLDLEIFTYSDALRYVPVERVMPSLAHDGDLFPRQFHVRFEGARIPLFYTLSVDPQPIAFHINVKPPLQYLYRYFWSQWLAAKSDDAQSLTFDEYVDHQVREVWKFPDLLTAARYYTNQYMKKLVPYDRGLGDFPAHLRALADKYPHTVVHRDGTVIGRSDCLSAGHP